MFTGLIREIGKIRALAAGRGVTRLDIEAPQIAAVAQLGQSIAVNGICLTVTSVKGRVFSVEAASETQRLTTFSGWHRGDRVHLEPALRAGDALDGHLVQGHVDGVGKILGVKKSGADLMMTVGCEPAQAQFLTPKGSVAVDGVSLTVDEGPFTDRFTVNIIPHTLQYTTFAGARNGRKVNLEMDVLVKAARTGQGWPGLKNNHPEPEAEPASGLTLDRLLSKGFSRKSSGRSGTKGRS